jgi:hypothetical protein
MVGAPLFLGVVLVFVGINYGFNTLLTGSPWMTPRLLFFAGDHWGFGPGVGFYGQHTVAAGFVNLDELLTILAIDLFGWPFYLTFVFLLMPFLTRWAVVADWVLLLAASIMVGAYIGYFYHGIYLGPRYLFETLPFLLILTARGILTLAAAGESVRARWRRVENEQAVEQPHQPHACQHCHHCFTINRHHTIRTWESPPACQHRHHCFGWHFGGL